MHSQQKVSLIFIFIVATMTTVLAQLPSSQPTNTTRILNNTMCNSPSNFPTIPNYLPLSFSFLPGQTALERRTPLHPNVAIAYRNMVQMGHRLAKTFGMSLPPMSTTDYTGTYKVMDGTLNVMSELFARMRARIGVYYQKSMFTATNGARPLNILFLGDSLTKYWTTIGGGVWDRLYKPRGSLNLGIGILSSGQLVKLVEAGLLDDLRPKVVVLFAGPTDLLMRVATGTQIAENVQKAIALIQQKVSGVKIIVMGLLPAEVPMETLLEGEAANNVISGFADGKNVFYLGLADLFGNEFGQIYPELYFIDNLHLGTCGYEVWAREMEPLLNKLLGEEKDE